MSKPRKTTQETQQAQEAKTAQETQQGIFTQDTQKEILTQETPLNKTKTTNTKRTRTFQTPLGPAEAVNIDDLPDDGIQSTPDGIPPEVQKELIDGIEALLKDELTRYADRPDMDRITDVFPDARTWTLTQSEISGLYVFAALTAVITYMDDLPGYLEANGIEASLELFATGINPDTGKTYIRDFIEYEEGEKEATLPQTINIIVHKPNFFTYPCDRISDKIFDAPEVQKGETLELEIKTNPKDKKNNPHFSYSIDFDSIAEELPFVRKLDSFDKRLVIGYGSLMDAGNELFTDSQLFKSMGNGRNPTPTERRKIETSLTKMNAQVILHNKAELNAGYNYSGYKYKGPFLPNERLVPDDDILIKINGREVDSVIHPLRYPFILELAAQRHESYKIPIAVLQLSSDISRSDFILQIEDYLIRRIADFKRGYSKQNKILYSTMYERLKVKADDRKAKKRMRDYIQRLLQHYVKVGWIKRFNAEKNSVTFYP